MHFMLHVCCELLYSHASNVQICQVYKCIMDQFWSLLRRDRHALKLTWITHQGVCKGSCQCPWLSWAEPKWSYSMNPRLGLIPSPVNQFGTSCLSIGQVIMVFLCLLNYIYPLCCQEIVHLHFYTRCTILFVLCKSFMYVYSFFYYSINLFFDLLL